MNRIKKWWRGLGPRAKFRIWFYGSCYISIIVGVGITLLIMMVMK